MKRLLVTLAALLLAATVLASCGSADAKAEEVSCNGNVAERLSKTEAELADAQKDATEAEGTLAESEATERVAQLEARVGALSKCGGEAASPATTAPTCPNSWARVDSDKAGNRWFAGGIPAIQSATTPEEARVAASEWMVGVRQDPVLLAGGAKFLVGRDVNQAGLFDASGCATQTAVVLVGEMEVALALSLIKPDEAPSDGYNSGTHDGNVVGSARPGVSGNRKAILIETPKGVKIWVMARCGNPVTTGKPPVPSGPTDENPAPTPPPKKPSPTTTVLTPKDPSKNIDRNPEVPEQVRKDRPSPDNQSRIDAGPTTPIDSPSGCNGPCPTTAPKPTAPPKVTVPESHGGNTGVTAPPTSAPPPAPPVTSSPTTPVTSP